MGIYSAIVDYDPSSHNKKLDFEPKPAQPVKQMEPSKSPPEPLKNSESKKSDEILMIENPPLENIYVSPELLKKLEDALKSK